MMVIIGGISGIVLLLVIILCLCYRRWYFNALDQRQKEYDQKLKNSPSGSKDEESNDEVSVHSRANLLRKKNKK